MTKKTISYKEAMEEIETIISRIENGDPDIDVLGEEVRRVTELIKICRKKLQKTEDEVNKILSEDTDN